jgi:hypothetical protein
MKTQFIPLLFVAAISALPGQSHADSAVTCERELRPGDRHIFTCPLQSFSSAQTARFSVELSGGHDDSLSTLALRHGDKDLTCAEGSKTLSEGEDGDITLECRFTLSPTSLAAPSKLLARIFHRKIKTGSFSLII